MVGVVVLDNSVVVPLVVSDEDSVYSERVVRAADTGTRLMAPALCMMEFGNAVLMCVRRERMTRAEAWSAHHLLEELPIKFGGGMSFLELTALQELALNSGLSFYDGAYLLMAMQQQARLATLDKALRAAAKAQGIEIFE